MSEVIAGKKRLNNRKTVDVIVPVAAVKTIGFDETGNAFRLRLVDGEEVVLRQAVVRELDEALFNMDMGI